MSRETDAQVAEKVFGQAVRFDEGPARGHFITHEWQFKDGSEFVFSEPGDWYQITGDPADLFPRAALIPHYSTDAGDAMRVIEHLRLVGIGAAICSYADGFTVELWKWKGAPRFMGSLLTERVPSMPDAVCKAALRIGELE